ncbi:FixH family protein [Rhizobium sp. Leaf341]|uniref:FixH family protein n=1 Tax=Rhizobium sp. Leaf341 TaxID=1736344 RepID=UPI000715E471|nr:FixH family protein [Rhizobium sp. Leaf341]KQR69382.1 hypothetical protein ASG03_09435 [Rhizobium sp. Leaf341]
MNTPSRNAGFTGRHMLAVMVAFFGIIIAVNITMARLAGSSFGGLVVENSYVASQEFNNRLKRSHDQLDLGWKPALEIQGGTIRFHLTDRSGKPVAVSSVVAEFRHPSYQAKDWAVRLQPTADGGFEARGAARDGVWTVQLDSDVGRQTPYRVIRRMTITMGTGQ